MPPPPKAAPGAWPCWPPTSSTAQPDQTLADYLTTRVFAGADVDEIKPEPADVAGFNAFIERYTQALPVQRAAVASS